MSTQVEDQPIVKMFLRLFNDPSEGRVAAMRFAETLDGADRVTLMNKLFEDHPEIWQAIREDVLPWKPSRWDRVEAIRLGRKRT